MKEIIELMQCLTKFTKKIGEKLDPTKLRRYVELLEDFRVKKIGRSEFIKGVLSLLEHDEKLLRMFCEIFTLMDEDEDEDEDELEEDEIQEEMNRHSYHHHEKNDNLCAYKIRKCAIDDHNFAYYDDEDETVEAWGEEEGIRVVKEEIEQQFSDDLVKLHRATYLPKNVQIYLFNQKKILDFLSKVHEIDPEKTIDGIYQRFLTAIENYRLKVLSLDGLRNEMGLIFRGHDNLFQDFLWFLGVGSTELMQRTTSNDENFGDSMPKLESDSVEKISGTAIEKVNGLTSRLTRDEQVGAISGKKFKNFKNFKNNDSYHHHESNDNAYTYEIREWTIHNHNFDYHDDDDETTVEAWREEEGIRVDDEEDMVKIRRAADFHNEIIRTESKSKGNKGIYDAFVHATTLYKDNNITLDELKDVIVRIFSDHEHLIQQFVQILSDSNLITAEGTIRERETKPIGDIDLSTCEEITHCYRLIPEEYRTAVTDPVLNNRYVSVGEAVRNEFVPRRRNLYEEKMIDCEEDMFEADMMKSALENAVKTAEQILRGERKLSYVGGMFYRSVKHIYGEHGEEMVQELKKEPMRILPGILPRLKKKLQELNESKKQWVTVWRDILKDYSKKMRDSSEVAAKGNNSKEL